MVREHSSTRWQGWGLKHCCSLVESDASESSDRSLQSSGTITSKWKSYAEVNISQARQQGVRNRKEIEGGKLTGNITGDQPKS